MPNHLMVAGPLACVPDDAEHDSDCHLIVGTEQISKAVGIGIERVSVLMSEGAPIWKLGNSYVVRRASLVAWLAERERAAVAERKGNAQ